MRLIEILSVIPDWQEVAVCIENGDFVDVIAVYDGTNSIPTEYNEAWVNAVYEYGGYIKIIIDTERGRKLW